MPHIRALFPETSEMIKFIRDNKSVIRAIVAACTSYPPEQVAFIPDMVPCDVADLSENLLPLELVIDAGSKCSGFAEAVAGRLKSELLLEIEDIDAINFGIWLRVMVDNAYVEHRPG